MGRHKEIHGPCTVEGCDRAAETHWTEHLVCRAHYHRLWTLQRSERRREAFAVRTWEPTLVAWVAGILEGEAHFKLVPHCAVKVNMTDEDVIRRLREGLGIGTVTGPDIPKPPRRKPQWFWQVSRREHLRLLLTAIRPLMGKRRGERIDAMLQALRPADKFHVFVEQHFTFPLSALSLQVS